jgi:hypothetical protein
MTVAAKPVKKVRAQEDEKPVISEIPEKTVFKNVLGKLGTPENMVEGPGRSRATAISSRSFRVNVYCRVGSSEADHLTDSFFVHVDDNGQVVSPAIVRRY